MEEQWAWDEWKGAAALSIQQRGSMADLTERLAAHPSLSFSAAAGTCGRQAFLRLAGPPPAKAAGHPETAASEAAAPVGSPLETDSAAGRGIGPGALLEGHRLQTAVRSREYPLILVAQDTTEFHFPHCPVPLGPQGLGPTSTERDKPGLFGHAALALCPDGLPLGVLHLAFWARDPEEFGKGKQRKRRTTAEKESQRWLNGVTAVEAALPPEQPAVVIQDREGDVFDLLALPRREQTFLLFRAAQNRNVTWTLPDGQTKTAGLFSVAAAGKLVGNLTVQVPRRRGQDAETAQLEIRVSQMTVHPPLQRKAEEKRQLGQPSVTVIEARETNPPEGEAAIVWVLVTTLTIETAKEAVEAVGYYACRWRIERLHYVLKSGLQVEDSQHESRAALERALALYYMAAWRILWLTYLARETPEAAATVIFSTVELRILAHATGKPVRTAREAVEALARLGGYVPYRKALPPGAKVLWRGHQCLQAALLGYYAREPQ